MAMGKCLLVGLTMLTMTCIHAKRILLCDLGGTFVDVNRITYALHELGIPSILMNGFTNNFQFNPQAKMFATLTKIDPCMTHAVTHENHTLPKIYCDWMAGLHNDPIETRDFIMQQVDILNGQGFFATSYEYRVVRKGLYAMFTPEKLVKHLYAIEPMFKLLERIDRSKWTIVVVSNWDPHSFPLFLASELGKRLCVYVKPEDFIISGYIGANKPDDMFFHEIFTRYGSHDETDYLFIDNESVNIQAALKHGIACLHYTGNHRQIYDAFIARDIIARAD